MINVTKTYLPDKEKYISYVEKIYKNGWVTNYGPLVQELEERLATYLGVKNIVLVSNGTAALEIAYRLLKLEGEVITTPFSFVATTSSLVSNKLKPVFADIDAKTLNIDPYLSGKFKLSDGIEVELNATTEFKGLSELDETALVANQS